MNQTVKPYLAAGPSMVLDPSGIAQHGHTARVGVRDVEETTGVGLAAATGSRIVGKPEADYFQVASPVVQLMYNVIQFRPSKCRLDNADSSDFRSEPAHQGNCLAGVRFAQGTKSAAMRISNTENPDLLGELCFQV